MRGRDGRLANVLSVPSFLELRVSSHQPRTFLQQLERRMVCLRQSRFLCLWPSGDVVTGVNDTKGRRRRCGLCMTCGLEFHSTSGRRQHTSSLVSVCCSPGCEGNRGILSHDTHFWPGAADGRDRRQLRVGTVEGLEAIEVAITIANWGSCLEIVFGDIFEQEGIRAIGVSEFFETKLGQPVSDKSLHGLFLKRHFSGYQDSIDRQIEEQLIDQEKTEVSDKVEGKSLCYPIGIMVLIKVNDARYILFALTKTNHENCKVYSDVELMWRALHKLWGRARVECNGYPLNLPLVGSGLSGLNLPTRDLLNLVILSQLRSRRHMLLRRPFGLCFGGIGLRTST